MPTSTLKSNHPLYELAFAEERHPILALPLSPADTMLLYLDGASAQSAIKPIDSSDALGDYLRGQLQNREKTFAYGGYGEYRVFYQQFTQYKEQEEPRCVHLGADVWAPAGTPLFAPLPGRVHSLAINDSPGDYGGTVILEHQWRGLQFYTLYGHLDHTSVRESTAGQDVEADSLLGQLGDERENGGWPPHLHFQVILNLQGRQGDYPGVASQSDAPLFLENCPDPIVFFPELIPLLEANEGATPGKTTPKSRQTE